VGKLPALEHNGRIVADSTDAAYYIEAQFPQPAMIPDDPALRGQVHILEDWADESLYFYEMHLRFTTPGNKERNVPRMVENEGGFLRWLLPKVVPGGIAKITASQGIGRKSIEQLLIDVKRHVRAVDDLLTDSEWLVGKQISLADLAVFAMFLALQDADMAAEIIAQFPRVTAWMERIEENTGMPVTPAN
jgi:glutathione S-transferase